tara:strand:+ start:253 stop:1221 length:969 start_codon:yes stop_codon:yes gene_type:complete
MAVYTKITEEQLKGFLAGYDLGELEHFEGIAQGVSNTNYHVFTNKDRYVLTIFEPRRVNEKDLPFFLEFSGFLAENGIECPQAMKDKNGNDIGEIQGQPAILINFLTGSDIKVKDLSAEHCGQMGTFLARMHNIADKFYKTRENSMGFDVFSALYKKISGQADEFETGLQILLKDELSYLQENWPQNLPSGVVHADAFPDNVFFDNGRLSAIIDFYFSCTDFYAFDLAITLNAWCFDEHSNFVPEKFEAFIKGYEEERPLNQEEKQAFHILCRAAVFRTLVSRLEEYFLYDPKTMEMTPHDPGAYLKRLTFHQEKDVMRELA